MRRTHLRGPGNILKRLLVHVAGFNLSLVLRKVLQVGTPRGLQGSPFDYFRPWQVPDDRRGPPRRGVGASVLPLGSSQPTDHRHRNLSC